MWSACHKFLRLPAVSKRFVVSTVLILPITYAGLKLFGLKRLLTRIQSLAPVPGEMPHRFPPEICAYTHLFSAVVRRCPLPLKCLGRSVALFWLLRLRGIDATVHIGVRKEDNCLDAHAWVQVGDFVMNDTGDVTERYTRLVSSYSEMDSIR